MKRIYFIDWLRIIAILIVFLFHNARFFDPYYWHIKNPQQSETVLYFIGFVNLWIMPLFFMLAGAASVFGIHKSFRKYSLGKIYRLLIPYVFGVLLLIPPQKYLEAVTQHQYAYSFFHFLGEYFSGGMFDYPLGLNSAWIGIIAYHLWFLGHLLVISIFLYPLLKYLNGKGMIIINWIYHRLSFYGGLILLFIPVAIVRILLKKSFPDYTSWADLAIFASYFLYGFVITKHEGFRVYLFRDRLSALITGIICTTAYFLSFGMKGTDFYELFQNYNVYGNYMFQEAMGALTTWAWLLVIMSLGAQYLDRESSNRQPLNEAVLPFYILHQTVILIIGFFVVQWEWNNWGKYAIIASSSLFVTVSLYLFAIKPFNPVRLLFGMNKIRK